MKSLLIIFIGAILVLFFGIKRQERKTLPLAIGILLLSLLFIPLDWMDFLNKKTPDWIQHYVPETMLAWDTPALAFSAVLIIACMLVFALFSRNERHGADLLGLMMFSLCGGLLMASFSNLIMLFLGIEVLSIPLYVLAGSRKNDLRSNEAALKYFLMGAFSTAIFLMGCAFTYGAAGSLEIGNISRVTGMMGHMGMKGPIMMAGILFLLAGMLFKVGAFPFHFWSPDVYDGSPNRSTVFMATVAKISAFAAFFRLFQYTFMDVKAWWGMTLAVASAVTILAGNIAALRQSSMKRTLAYSSVAHAGYMLLAVLATPLDGFWALLVYTLAYAASAATVFYLLDKIAGDNGNFDFDRFNGFGSSNRLASLALIVSMFSMAGIPLTAGFAGKYGLFASALQAYPWLVVIALLGSAVSIAYYFRVFRNAFMTPGAEGRRISIGTGEGIALGLAVMITLLVGLWPSVITGLQILAP